MKKALLVVLALALALVVSLVAIPAQGATDDEIKGATEKGLVALVGLQNPDGSWGDLGYPFPHPVAVTCLALVKLQERAYELPEIENPFDPDYEYSDEVIDGWKFVLQAANITQEAIPIQDAGDPDVNGNDYGLDFAPRPPAPPPVERYGYTQGIVLMAMAATGTPNRQNEGGLDFTGDGLADTYLELAQDVAEHLAYGQVDRGFNEGGWHYGVCNNGDCLADNSTTGYSVLGLAGAEEFGVTLPAFVKSELDVWVNNVQNLDGGSRYTAANPLGASNILRTGNLIFEQTFVDGAAAPGTPRFQSALSYIENTWQDPDPNEGWKYSGDPADYQAMYTVMKGFEYSGIDLIDTDGDGERDDNWFNQEPPAVPAQDFASVLVQQQDPVTGLWPSDCHEYGCQTLCQIWALLILEKTVPPPPAKEVPVDIKPTSCRNPLNVGAKGIVPVAILGTDEFDVREVDPTTVKLGVKGFDPDPAADPVEWVAPLRWAQEDVATPYEPYIGKEGCFACTEEGPDGYLDLTLKFDTQELVSVLGAVEDGDCLTLVLTGNLIEDAGGTSIVGEDVVAILMKGKK